MEPAPVPQGEAFPKAARLQTPRDFGRVQREGTTYDQGPLVFRVAPRPVLEGEPPQRGRLGLAVSRRVGKAVARNWVKRRVRECFRKRQGSLAGFDLVVTARPAAAQLATGEVDRHFLRLLARLGRS